MCNLTSSDDVMEIEDFCQLYITYIFYLYFILSNKLYDTPSFLYITDDLELLIYNNNNIIPYNTLLLSHFISEIISILWSLILGRSSISIMTHFQEFFFDQL